MSTHSSRLLMFVVAAIAFAPLASADVKKRDTIESLEKKEVEIRRGEGVVLPSSELARDSYREFLELASEDLVLRAEAMRRLGDLELDAMEAEQLAENVESISTEGYDNAAAMYERLLQEYPDYRRNDAVLYQLGRAYESGGRNEEALVALNGLIQKYPNTPMLDEVQFRRGELLFMQKNYNDAELAYSSVVDYGETSRFYEQSLYKLGWSQFKLAWHEDSLDSFFELLDRKIGNIELQGFENLLEQLSRAEQELVEDTFRVLSISFSYMDGAASVQSYFDANGSPEYSYVIYRNLGDLYLEKERFVDAAETYDAFVAQNPDHEKAPLLQAEVIEAYKLGGFATLVLDGKRAYVDRYSMSSEYWTDNPRAENPEAAELLKANLMDLAQFSHAEAQKNGQAKDYQEAARLYRRYLEYFPGEADSANTNFLLAEILFESDSFEAAAIEYGHTAYDYPPHERSAEAGYAAILAYRAHEATLQNSNQADRKAAWHSSYLDSGLKFATAFPDHPESGAVLATVAEDLFAQDEFDLAITVGTAVVTKQPPVAAELARTGWTVIAHSQFDLGEFALAEQSYYRLRSFTPVDDATAAQEIDDRIASSIYKQGELARDMGLLDQAVGHFSRLGDVVPDSDIRMTAEYDAAAALINMQDWDRASVALEDFRREYPDSEFADDITQKLAVSYLSAGRANDAAAEFERVAVAAESSDEVRREALWQASDLYKQSGAVGDEQRVLTSIINTYPNPLSESIEARYRLLEIAQQSGNEAQRMARLEDMVRVDASAGSQRSDRTRYLAAIATLELAEPLRRSFESVRLTQPLAQSMKIKRARMEEVIAAYTNSADYGVAEVTTAATFRLGQAYENFSRDLLASERPRDLDEAALEQYDLLLEEQIFPFEEKAIELYMVNTDRAPDGVYDEWVQKSFARLASLMPARYAKGERSENVVTTLY